MVDLTEIQKLQFTDLASAESQLLSHLQASGFENIAKIKVLPKPQSLNSISGLVTMNDGEELFFKTHTEENEQLAEYYNAELLESVGYPVIKAEVAEQKPGSQLALYKKIELPTLFDLVHKKETLPSESWKDLLEAQVRLDQKTLEIYQNTLEPISAEENKKQPIHQLFAHRLSNNGRVHTFYKNGKIGEHSIQDLFSKKWRVNGTRLSETILESISKARKVLDPSIKTNSVIGHGDAHNGNIFFDGELHYFDPAFCGRHSPTLDLVKPLFHNLFGRWMYLPQQVDREFELSLKIESNEIIVEHNFEPSSLRLSFLESKISNILSYLTNNIDSNILQYGMFCCPLLTVNLVRTEPGRLESAYSEKVRLLGLTLTILCTSENQPNDRLGQMLGKIFSCGKYS